MQISWNMLENCRKFKTHHTLPLKGQWHFFKFVNNFSALLLSNFHVFNTLIFCFILYSTGKNCNYVIPKNHSQIFKYLWIFTFVLNKLLQIKIK